MRAEAKQLLAIANGKKPKGSRTPSQREADAVDAVLTATFTALNIDAETFASDL